jgi:hypothetical protein
MSRTFRRTLIAAITFLIPACATTSEPGARSSFGDITIGEIEEANASDAYILVQRLRPGWLRQRGSSSINRPTPRVVYLDNMRVGGLDSLRQISANSIERIRFLDSPDATQRFGTGHVNGAILVFTR